MPYVDFDDLRQRFSIEQIAQLLGLQLTRRGDQLRGECPACKSGGERALTITPTHRCKNGAIGAFYCQVEKQGGDSIQLIAHIRGTDVHKAASWLDGNSVNSKRPRDSGTVPRTEAERGFKPLDYLEPDHDAVTIGVGFSAEIAQELGIGYAPRGILKGTVAIPIRDESGELRGYIGINEATLPASFKPVDSKVVPLKRA